MLTRIGQQMGNYHLIRLLGQGGFADVYLGEHLHLGTLAAIKVLQRRLAGEHLKDFIAEAKTLARLKHPHIIRILEFGVTEDDKTPFLVMDYASAGTLRQQHPRGMQVPLETIIQHVTQIADALQYAHGQKQIHRDVKPENMLLGENHEVLLSDFGLVLVAHSRSAAQSTKEMAGTVSYMAPEQFLGKPRFASDQYALGIVVYEWLCGEPPFTGTFTEIASQHLYSPVPPLSMKNRQVTPALEQAVGKALAKEPQERFPDIQHFAEALKDAAKTAQSLSYRGQSLNLAVSVDEELLSTFVKNPPAKSSQPPSAVTQKHPQQPSSYSTLITHSASQTNRRKDTKESTGQQIHSLSEPTSQLVIDLNESMDEDSWMNLRWFILVSAILTPVLFFVGSFLQVPIITVMSLVTLVTCIVLGLLQTGHFDQWYWLTGFLLLSPVVAVLYSIFNPDTKPNPPNKLKQLIIILSCLGFALFPVAIFISSWPPTSNGPTWIMYYICGVFLLASWLLGLIRCVRGMDIDEWIFLFIFFPPLAGIISVFWDLNKSGNAPN